MKKAGCAIIAVTILMFLTLGILAIPSDTRERLFNTACRAASKLDVGLDKDHCMKGIAVFFGSSSMCNWITGEKFVTEYKGEKIQLENPPKMECLTEIAVEKNYPSLCDNVEGLLIANTKIDCLYRVAAGNNNSEACNMIGEKEQSRLGMKMNQAGCMAQLKK